MNPNQTILIIEDEPGFRRTYSDLFNHYGHNVLEAENGKLGWELARLKHPDLILLDLVMPEMDGYEVLQCIRAEPSTRNIPVIIFSVLGEQTDIQRALELGASDYIIKGFYSPGEVLKKIGQFLAQPEIGYEKL